MTPERLQQVEALFCEVLKRHPEQRAAYLAAATDDPELRDEALSLLSAHQLQGRFDGIVASFREFDPAPESEAFDILVERLGSALAGRYQIERELGRGGMALVFLAQDLKHGRPVAIKVLRPDLSAAIGTGRFLREIQIIARLQHPNIMPLYDSGVVEGSIYYTMPFMEGESLRARLEREGRLPIMEAVRITRDVAEALSYAHSHNVIHRDIKPDNILLAGDRYLLADFSIARATTAAGDEPLTETGTLLGTPTYASPEQGAGKKDVDARSDIYSLGCVVYEMLAGRPPFTGETPQEILAHHALDPVPPLRKARREVSLAVEDAICTALAKPPVERFATATAFVEALADSTPAHAGLRWRQLRRASRTPRGRRYATLGLSALLLGGVVATRAAWRRPSTVSPVASAQSVAVLPFINLSGDTANEYLSDGMTEELISALVQIPGLRVPARTSAFVFKGKTADIREIGRRLNVARVVEGSVQRAGSRLRVTAQLINVADGYHIWSATYDRHLRDVFEVEDDLVGAIASAVRVRLGTRVEATRPPTENPAAHEAYLRGRYAWYLRTPKGVQDAVVFFQRAIALDPGYALAWSGLADAYWTAGVFNYLPLATVEPLERVAALTAVARDSTLAEAWTSLARLRDMDWDWAGADQAFRQAIALNPRYALAHSWYGQDLAQRLGRAEQGIREGGIAIGLDPLNPVFKANQAVDLVFGRRYADAIAYADTVIEGLPGWWDGYMVRGSALLNASQTPGAIVALERARRLNPGFLHTEGLLGLAYARAGNVAAAQATLVNLEARSREPGYWGAVALVQLGLGAKTRALDALDQAVERRDFSAGPTFAWPGWDPLRSDPRFARAAANAGVKP